MNRLLLHIVGLLTLINSAAAQVSGVSISGNFTINDCPKIINRTHIASSGSACGSASSVPYTGITNVPTSSLLGRQTAGTGAAEVLTATANAFTLIGHTFAQMRSDLALVIGTNVEAWDADLDTLAGKTIPSGATLADTSSAQTFTGKSYMGRADGSNPCTGCIGEILASPIGSPISLSTATPADLTSLPLTAGVWDCQATAEFIEAAGGTTSVTKRVISISGTSITQSTVDGTYGQITQPATVAGANAVNTLTTPIVRFALSGTTTKYAVVTATFTVSTMTMQGNFRCVRAG